MAVDLKRFHAAFFEESLEGVAAMEAELLDVERLLRHSDADSIDPERLNRIFRAAHSIKGGSGTFGFSLVADFSHSLETLLDAARSGRRTLDLPTVSLVLRAVDCLRGLLDAARSGVTTVPAEMATLRAELESAQAAKHVAARAKALPLAPVSGWFVRFYPLPQFFHSGNDPMHLMRMVAELGSTTLRVDASRIPAWDEFNPESCYLGWELMLNTPVQRSVLDEAFAWVIGNCELDFEPIVPAPEPVSDPAPAPARAQVSAPAEHRPATSIRVATAKVDALVDMVGELLITQTMLSQLIEGFTPEALPQLRNAAAQLERHTRMLQDGVLGIRMLPIAFVFSRLPRLARDLSNTLGKHAELSFSGERTELDKTIIERISDPLIHMVRNSIAHGIESPQERVQAGKPPVGTIRLDAYHKGGNFVLEIEDDGRGLDRERILQKARERGLIGADIVPPEPSQIDEFIFAPGFSTADSVSEISGRGVGLDVVRNNIRSLGGGVEVSSVPGGGTRFTLRLPLTLAIVDGMSLQVGSEVYILPLAWIAESLRVLPEQVSQPAGGPEILTVRGEYLPLLRLSQLFGVAARSEKLSDGIVVIIEADSKRAALFVDEVLGQQQVVLKSLEKHCHRMEGIAAATILGNGTVALILDAGSLARRAHGSMTVMAGTVATTQLGVPPAALH